MEIYRTFSFEHGYAIKRKRVICGKDTQEQSKILRSHLKNHPLVTNNPGMVYICHNLNLSKFFPRIFFSFRFPALLYVYTRLEPIADGIKLPNSLCLESSLDKPFYENPPSSRGWKKNNWNVSPICVKCWSPFILLSFSLPFFHFVSFM